MKNIVCPDTRWHIHWKSKTKHRLLLYCWVSGLHGCFYVLEIPECSLLIIVRYLFNSCNTFRLFCFTKKFLFRIDGYYVKINYITKCRCNSKIACKLYIFENVHQLDIPQVEIFFWNVKLKSVVEYIQNK